MNRRHPIVLHRSTTRRTRFAAQILLFASLGPGGSTPTENKTCGGRTVFPKRASMCGEGDFRPRHPFRTPNERRLHFPHFPTRIKG